MQFERAMTYACQMMHRRISTTAKENAIVEEKVATAEGSMTNRIMFTDVIVAGEKRMNTQLQQPSQNSNGQKAEGQYMAGKNMEFHKSHDVDSEGRPQKGSYARAQKKGERCPSTQV
jgi:hypothetical protein